MIDARSQKVFVCAYDQGKALISEQMMAIADFPQFMQNYQDFQVVGQNEVVGYEHVEVNLASHLHELAKNESACENVDALVPRYLKDVEAKKICL